MLTIWPCLRLLSCSKFWWKVCCSHHNNIQRELLHLEEKTVITVTIFWNENAIWLAFGSIHAQSKKKKKKYIGCTSWTRLNIYYILVSWNGMVKVVPNLGSLENYVSMLFVYIFKARRSVNISWWGLRQVIMEQWMC